MYESSYYLNHSTADGYEISTPQLQTRNCRTVRLLGFNERDRVLLQHFLYRPGGTGLNLAVVECDEDLLIVNTIHNNTVIDMALQHWDPNKPTIGVVECFESDLPFYQIVRDSTLLFSLAQAINRIRNGWSPLIKNVIVDTATPEIKEVLSLPTPQLRRPIPGLPWQRALEVLVIDDSQFSRASIAEVLGQMGFHIVTAEGGEIGVRLASERKFDVALVDFEMPGMLGPEVLRQLRKLRKQSPTVLIMLTSRGGMVDRLRAKFAGADAFLTKPTQVQDFLLTLQSFAAIGKFSYS